MTRTRVWGGRAAVRGGWRSLQALRQGLRPLGGRAAAVATRPAGSGDVALPPGARVRSARSRRRDLGVGGDGCQLAGGVPSPRRAGRWACRCSLFPSRPRSRSRWLLRVVPAGRGAGSTSQVMMAREALPRANCEEKAEGLGARAGAMGMRTRPDGRARRRRAAGAFHDSGRHGRRAGTAGHGRGRGAGRTEGGGRRPDSARRWHWQAAEGLRPGTQGGAAPGRVRIETTWTGRGTARPAKGGEGARGGGRRDEASPRAPRPPAPVHACSRLGCLRLRPLARRAPRRPRHLSLGQRTSTEIERAPPVRTPVTLTLTLTRHASSPPAPTPAPPLRLRWRAVAPLVRLPRRRPAARA